jgi:hypothetical protein
MAKNPNMFKDATKALAEQGYEPPIITNYKMSDGEKPVAVPLSMPEVLAAAHDALGDWPRRLDSVPFVDEGGDSEIHLFDRDRTAALFGWIRGKCKVEWKSGGFIPRDEFICELVRRATCYKSIEQFPHEPLIGDVYYREHQIKPGNGKRLEALLDRYNPETTADRQLIKAALLTLFWGGSPGARPVFVSTSDEGRGVGKTKLVETAVYTTGEMPLSVHASGSIDDIKKRLLSKEGRRKRAFLLDNVKSRNLSWADLEALVTASDISGTQLYVGEGSRRNYLTYFLTFNAASLSKDMAQRSVIIKIVRGNYNSSWETETRAFIDEHRIEIIGDIIAALRAKPKVLKNFTRWAEWEQAVLCRLANPTELQSVILERQGSSDTDSESASLLESFFAERLADMDPAYDPATAQVRIPIATVVDWYNAALGVREKTIAASKAIRQMIEEGDLQRLQTDSTRTYGRCFIWTGEKADRKQPISNDFNERSINFRG